MRPKIFLFLVLLISPLIAIEEGTFTEYEKAEQKSESEALQESYQYPLIKKPEEPSEKKELSLQQQLVDYFGTFVSSSPYPGVRATFEGNELMANLSSINKDLQILLELEKANEFLEKNQIPYPKHPRIFMSGQIEFTGFIQKNATNHYQSDLDLTDTELDFLVVMTPWLYGFISFEYDNSPDPSLSNTRFANSRIKGDSIFVTFGDLNRSPWYVTVGQTFSPFGQYSTYAPIHNPLTKTLFRTFGREVALGFFNNLLQASVFVFKGSSHADSGHNINNYGCNLGLHFNRGDFQGKIATGLIRNSADSVGMQAVFGDPSNSETLKRIVPGINGNINLTWKKWNLIGEYNRILRPFDSCDAAFSSDGVSFKGARPQAFDIELAYSFNALKRPSSIALSYSKSWQSLGFNVPKERMTLTWAWHIFRGNLLSFEVNSDKLYGKNSRVKGNIATGNPYYINPKHLGHRDYSFGIDYLFYF